MSLPIYGYSIGRKVHHKNQQDFSYAAKNTFIELIFCLSGTGTARLYKEEFALAPGKVFAYFPGEEHLLTANSESWETLWLTVDGPLALSLFASYGHARLLEIPLEYSMDKLNCIRNEIEKASPAAVRRVSLCILELFAYPGETEKESGNLDGVLLLINDNLSNIELDVNFLAEYFGCHRATFNRLFKQKMGRTPYEYIHSLRLTQGKALLGSTSLTVKQIAENCGFRDESSFCRAFRKVHKVPPGKYRRALAGDKIE